MMCLNKISKVWQSILQTADIRERIIFWVIKLDTHEWCQSKRILSCGFDGVRFSKLVWLAWVWMSELYRAQASLLRVRLLTRHPQMCTPLNIISEHSYISISAFQFQISTGGPSAPAGSWLVLEPIGHSPLAVVWCVTAYWHLITYKGLL